jgi:hypothetical protein
MQDFFASVENRVYSFLAVLIGLCTLLFIAPHITLFTLLDLGLANTPFYISFLILGILTIGALAYFSPRFEWKHHLSIILLTWLPGSLILTYGLTESKNFHYIFILSLGLYVILAGILLSALYIQKERLTMTKDPEALSVKEWFRAQGLPVLLSVLIATIIFGGAGLYRLTEYAAVDEPLWFDGRIAKYWKNIGERDWRGTNISDKPGITVALASGPGLFFKSTKDYRTAHVDGEVVSLRNDVEAFYLAYRLPLLIVITLLLPLFYFFLERLLGKRNALLSYILIATSPILIGMSKIINPDSLLWLFTPLSLVAYLTFLKRHSFRYLIFSGIFLGLSLLTKYVSNILFIFFLGLIFLEYLYHKKDLVLSFAEHLKNSLQHLALLTFTALTTFYLFFPAVWVKPEKLLDGTVLSQAFEKVAPIFGILLVFILADQWWNKSRITSALLALLEGRTKQVLTTLIAFLFLGSLLLTLGNTWGNMGLYDFSELLASPKTIAGKSDFLGAFLTNFYPLIFGVTPLVALALFLTPFFFLRKSFAESTSLRTAFYLMIFILLYYIGTTVNNVGAIVRYQIILFPFAAIIAGITLEHLLVFVHKKWKVADTPTPVIAGLILLVFGGISLLTTPFPLSYANVLLPAKYHIDVKDMGAGSYEAAQYLNSLPGAQDMLVWTDKDGVCKFFIGRCSSAQNYTQLRERGLDYIVTSAGRKSRTTKMMGGDIANNRPGIIRFDQYYDRTNPVYEIDINGRPSHYVKVFKFEE